MRKATCVLWLLVTSTLYSFAQTKQTTSVQQIWLGYFNQTRFSNKFGAWADLHIRTKEDFFTNFSHGIIRVGLTYYANDALKMENSTLKNENTSVMSKYVIFSLVKM